jgi:methionine-rich copper-binding protein CopC
MRLSLITRLFTIVALLLVASVPRADAHAFLDHASPTIGSTVAGAPHEVVLSFTQNLEAAFSTVAVTDPSGARVDQGKPQIGGNTMRVGLKALSAGTYKVRWHVLSVDTHTTEGAFSFTVNGH